MFHPIIYPLLLRHTVPVTLGPVADQLIAPVAKPAKASAIDVRRAEGVLAAVRAGEAVGLAPTLEGRQAGVF